MNSESIDRLYITRFIEANDISDEEARAPQYQEMIVWLDKFVTYFASTTKISSYRHISYARIYEIIRPIENREFKIFINNLLILNILDDHFQACDFDSDEVIPIEKEWINECVVKQLYVDPFTEESISKEEFSKKITRYYYITTEIKENKKHEIK